MEKNILVTNSQKILDFWGNNLDLLTKLDPHRYASDIRDEKVIELDRLSYDLSSLEADGKKLRICVAGGFNAGKSTFINSLIGEELLVMGWKPETYKVTVLSHGDEYKFVVVNTGEERVIITREEYKNYSSRRSKDHPDLADVSHFEVKLPCSLLSQIEIVDTPGFEAPQDKESTDKTTRRWMDKSDYLIWTCNADKGDITDTEKEIISKIEKNIIIIVNRFDYIVGGVHERILASFEKHLRSPEDTIYPYAAAPVLNYSVSRKENENSLERFMSKLKERIKSGREINVDSDGNLYDNGEVTEQLMKTEEKCDALYIQYHENVTKYLKEQINNKEFRSTALKKRLHDKLYAFFDDLKSNIEYCSGLIQAGQKVRKDWLTTFKKKYRDECEKHLARFEKKYDQIKDLFFHTPPQFLERKRGEGKYGISTNDDSIKKVFEEQIPKFVNGLYNAFIEVHTDFLRSGSRGSVDLEKEKKRIGIELEELIKKSKGEIPSRGRANLDKILSKCRLNVTLECKKGPKTERFINSKLIDLIFQDESLFHYLRSYIRKLQHQFIGEEEKRLKHESDKYDDMTGELHRMLNSLVPEPGHAESRIVPELVKK